MPFLISGNIEQIEPNALRHFSKKFGLILSKHQSIKEQQKMLQSALQNLNFKEITRQFGKKELLSFIFILTQFGDVSLDEIPLEYSYLKNVPYVLEWSRGHFTVPFEVLDFLANQKILKKQGYLFSLLPQLSLREKKAWVRWLGIDYEGKFENKLNHEIYYRCRIIQQRTEGKSRITESEIPLQSIWERGNKDIIDWFYQGLTSFYFAIQELSFIETDPYVLELIRDIKCGKFILKKLPEKFGKDEEFVLVKTVEGKTPQLRKTVYHWELERESKNSLFSTQKLEKLI